MSPRFRDHPSDVRMSQASERRPFVTIALWLIDIAGIIALNWMLCVAIQEAR